MIPIADTDYYWHCIKYTQCLYFHYQQCNCTFKVIKVVKLLIILVITSRVNSWSTWRHNQTLNYQVQVNMSNSNGA